jgi:hypothetical protein
VAERGAAAEPELRRAIDLDVEGVSPSAARLVCELRGLERIWPDYRLDLSPHLRQHCALCWASSYASNGGIIQAFKALHEDNAAALEPALADLAPPEVARIWVEAIRILTGGGPLPADQDERDDLIADRYSAIEDRLDQLSREFFAVAHRLDVSLFLCAADHADEFRPVLWDPTAD